MKELKDIVLKKGDLIYLTNNEIVAVSALSNNLKANHTSYDGIIKIERPIKYETIYKAPKQILDKEEKKYLENYLRPFRNKTKEIYKETDIGQKKEWLCFYIGHIWYELPMFDKNTMYKGMKLKKGYTLEELGLFKGDKL